MNVRPLSDDDVPEAARVALAALPMPPGFPDEERLDWLERRTAHLVRTDPAGAWVAEEDGEVTGMALALVRDGIWGLSLLAVRPAVQARGTGSALLRAALTHEGGGRAGIILSSTDPKAMRLYARAGFDLRPCVAFAGILDREVLPAGLQARASDDVEQAAALSAPVRGGAYGPQDLALLLGRPRMALHLLPGRGFVLGSAGSPILLAATDEAAAIDLLWSCLAAAPRGATVDGDFLTAGQDWAIRTVLEARLALSPDGPVFTRGPLGPLRPWIPSGSML